MKIDEYDSSTPEPEFDGMTIDEIEAALADIERETADTIRQNEYMRKNRFSYGDPAI